MSIGLVVSAGAAEAVGGTAGPGLSACRLEFDINSDFGWKEPFDSGRVMPLLDEFVDLSAELANRGDVP